MSVIVMGLFIVLYALFAVMIFCFLSSVVFFVMVSIEDYREWQERRIKQGGQ